MRQGEKRCQFSSPWKKESTPDGRLSRCDNDTTIVVILRPGRGVAKRRLSLLFRRVRPIGCHGGPWILMESGQAHHAGFGAGMVRTPRRRCRCRYFRNTRAKVSAPIEATLTASKFTSRNRVDFEVSGGSTSAGSVAGPAAPGTAEGPGSVRAGPCCAREAASSSMSQPLTRARSEGVCPSCTMPWMASSMLRSTA